MGISLGDFGTTDGGVLHPIRHPGLAPGPIQTGGDAKTTHQTVIPDLFRGKSRHPGLAPGPTQTGRDLKTTTAGYFQDPEYRWGDFGTTDGGVLQPIRHPGLVPGP